MKKISKIFFTLVLSFVLLITFNINVFAESKNKVYLGGENIGIKINTGIVVIGKYEVETTDGKVAPWKNSNIQKGDKIISIDRIKVDNNQSLLSILKTSKKNTAILLVERDSKQFETIINIVVSKNNQKSIGLYIKDKLMGIGTLTFINPENYGFASLGHGIYNNQKLYLVNNGVVLSSKVNSIRKATPGNAGEKTASLDNQVIGSISDNKVTGLYGKLLKSSITKRRLIDIGKKEDVHLGPAKIVTTLTDNTPKEYDIEIIGVETQEKMDIKGIKIKITDETLLKETGGIVQGMSGSPIIQDDKLVGAVSHVIVDEPTTGYGMYIEWMIEDLKNVNK